MAEIYNLGAGITFYNVSKAVGDGMPNQMDDVMLVQWLLKHHFERADKKAMLGSKWSIPVINGVCSATLIDIIKIYQYDANLNVKNADMPLNGAGVSDSGMRRVEQVSDGAGELEHRGAFQKVLCGSEVGPDCGDGCEGDVWADGDGEGGVVAGIRRW
ncbi:MAG: hypothetical protein JNK87_11975 [Bryobacterales bacterium]|nr:hypothetical protein [Bryobacterales bacterium]